jgi:hypothetical protein
MSADNTIVVLEMKDGYRVAHVQAIDNLEYEPDYPPEKPVLSREYLGRLFGTSKVYTFEKEAVQEAWKLYKRFGYVEYGVQHLNFSSVEFPSEG